MVKTQNVVVCGWHASTFRHAGRVEAARCTRSAIRVPGLMLLQSMAWYVTQQQLVSV